MKFAMYLGWGLGLWSLTALPAGLSFPDAEALSVADSLKLDSRQVVELTDVFGQKVDRCFFEYRRKAPTIYVVSRKKDRTKLVREILTDLFKRLNKRRGFRSVTRGRVKPKLLVIPDSRSVWPSAKKRKGLSLANLKNVALREFEPRARNSYRQFSTNFGQSNVRMASLVLPDVAETEFLKFSKKSQFELGLLNSEGKVIHRIEGDLRRSLLGVKHKIPELVEAYRKATRALPKRTTCVYRKDKCDRDCDGVLDANDACPESDEGAAVETADTTSILKEVGCDVSDR